MNDHIDTTKYSPDPRDVYFTVPNFISLLRILSIPIIAVLVAHHRMIPALAVLALSALSDGMDGLIARTFNQVSKIGQLLDPIADRLLILSSIFALGLAGIIPMWMLVVVAMRDLLMGVLVLLLAQHDYGPLPVNFVGKTGTALLMTAFVTLIVADVWDNLFAHTLHLVALAVGIWGVGVYWLAGCIYFRQGFSLIHDAG
jgi:cardiolipin synthase